MKSRPIKDIGGRRNGRLIALKFIKRENNHTYWSFKCDCGKLVIKDSHRVSSRKIKSCGCLNEERIQNLVELAHLKRIPNNGTCKNRLYRNYKKQATKRGLTFSLSKKQFESFLNKKCYYCEAEPANLMLSGKFGKLRYNGIDRKINIKGYTMKNCVAACYKCNKMKMNLNIRDFLKQVRKIFEWRIA